MEKCALLKNGFIRKRTKNVSIKQTETFFTKFKI